MKVRLTTTVKLLKITKLSFHFSLDNSDMTVLSIIIISFRKEHINDWQMKNYEELRYLSDLRFLFFYLNGQILNYAIDFSYINSKKLMTL